MLGPELGTARRTSPRRAEDAQLLDRVAYPGTDLHAHRLRTFLLLLASLPLLILLLVPLIALVARVAPEHLVLGLRSETALRAIYLSMRTSLLAVLLTLALGTPLAYILARRRFRGHLLVDTLVDLPMVLPPAVAGIALLVAFGRRGLVGRYLADAGLDIPFSTLR